VVLEEHPDTGSISMRNSKEILEEYKARAKDIPEEEGSFGMKNGSGDRDVTSSVCAEDGKNNNST
jgi:hypothetical protein